MKTLIALVALVAAIPAAAAVSGNQGRLGETWVWPAMFEQTLAPLAPMAQNAIRSGQCPTLAGKAGVAHTFEYDAKMKTRGTGENKRWEVAELKLLTPSGCDVLDAQVTSYMQTAIPKFAEPWRDLDKNGWTRIPPVQVKLD
ncbi:hypothetical protein FJQ54_11055 [Sandaracinobacter neustonicus]|uniref:Uncharacterized protein n=1 Tax=Sandaracinobacter neustonicus TaxID=1715348 RepID=A0A501XIQ3_9SPHN|nr:hypothetical protein [Sandaracinobacter neustonicus]TPE60531.1 hypothetical protein FJQ54_11055 [Sandaracinobacter neustonicus]